VRYEYYENLKSLARGVREHHGLSGPRVLKSDLRRIYKAEGIQLDYWPYPLKGLRGAYFNDQHGKSVMIAKEMPVDPTVFTMAHELKHHLVDSDLGVIKCMDKTICEPIEIGAEVFAAEFLFPEQVFVELMSQLGVQPGRCTAEDIVRLKHESKTTLSYAGLVKRAEWLKYAEKDTLPRSGLRSLELQMYGVPFYRRRTFIRIASSSV
jgi:Zn-dependent peptidase ImmA (M78 family)